MLYYVDYLLGRIQRCVNFVYISLIIPLRNFKFHFNNFCVVAFSHTNFYQVDTICIYIICNNSSIAICTWGRIFET